MLAWGSGWKLSYSGDGGQESPTGCPLILAPLTALEKERACPTCLSTAMEKVSCTSPEPQCCLFTILDFDRSGDFLGLLHASLGGAGRCNEREAAFLLVHTQSSWKSLRHPRYQLGAPVAVVIRLQVSTWGSITAAFQSNNPDYWQRNLTSWLFSSRVYLDQPCKARGLLHKTWVWIRFLNLNVCRNLVWETALRDNWLGDWGVSALPVPLPWWPTGAQVNEFHLWTWLRYSTAETGF